MKKQYHYTISRTDRICLVAFVFVLLSWELVKGFFPGEAIDYQYIPGEKKPYTTYKKDYKKTYPAKKFKPYKSRYKEYPSRNYKKEYPKSPPPSLPILITEASVNELTSMGFTVKVAFNIQKYISSGGQITKPGELMKIYGMDSTQLLNASPYIIYPPPKSRVMDEINNSPEKDNSTADIIDLNTASVAELESMKGIGAVLAGRIIKFRESLGGFVYPEQLRDCYGISPELYEQLKSGVRVSGDPKKISLNEADLSSIRHPYFSKKMASLIKSYQHQHGPITSEDELKKVYPADSNWFEKVLPYISFEIEVQQTKNK